MIKVILVEDNFFLQKALEEKLSNFSDIDFRELVQCDFIELLCIYSTIIYKLSDSISEFEKWATEIELSILYQ